MRGIVFNLLNEQLRKNDDSEGWDWLYEDEDALEIQVDADAVVMPLSDEPSMIDGMIDGWYWAPLSSSTTPRKPN